MDHPSPGRVPHRRAHAPDLRHAPACATTLIVSLGLLSTPREGLLVVASVAVLVAVHRVGRVAVVRGQRTLRASDTAQ